MNQNKFDSIYRGLTAQAKKVYECIPISDSWSPAQIMGDLHRRNVSMNDYHVVMGCINSMIDSGLIVETKRGMFRREEIKPKPEPIESKQEPKTEGKEVTKAIQATTPPDPLERMSAFASKLRALASEMETAAIDLAVQAEKNEEETAKMRQLQALLKSLG